MSNQIVSQSLWKNRDYLLLWSGQVVSTLGSSISAIVYPLLILEMTGSPAAAGITSALSAIPYVLLSLPVGALVDRWDRKRVLILCDIGRFIVLAAMTTSLFLNVISVWQIYLSAFLEGIFYVIFNLAEVAALPRVVSKPMLPRGSGTERSRHEHRAHRGPVCGNVHLPKFWTNRAFFI